MQARELGILGRTVRQPVKAFDLSVNMVRQWRLANQE